MIEIAVKGALTFILLSMVYFVWTNKIDVTKTLSKALAPIVSFKKESRLDIDFKQAGGARLHGQLCLFFYVLRFVNSSDESVTVKEILLRVQGPLGKHTVDSTVVVTGETQGTKKEMQEAAILQMDGGRVNIVMADWKNLRPILGAYKTLSPGAVLAGSAAFILENMTIQQFKQLKMVELVAVDFSGNETVKLIEIESVWIEQADGMVFADRDFLAVGQGITWR